MGKVETYQMLASNGRPARKATQVRYPDGTLIRFTERMSRKQALAQAALQRKMAKN
jgi:hypothetical protein